jgi:predicted hydrolase (HD superfamily)
LEQENTLSEKLPGREQAWQLLCEFNESKALRAHALAVEGVMRYRAGQTDNDQELWGLVGLLHDLDYERYPDRHCEMSREILNERGWPELIIRAVVSHGWGVCSDVEPLSEMEKTLFAMDELTGLVAATALVRPSRSVLDTPVKSVKKKWKNARFAAGVDRELIDKGAAMLGMERDELIAEVIAGMREVAEAIGLKGEIAT